MCDTLCSVQDGRTVFAKNSDRPPDEPQIVEAFPARPGGGALRTQYLEIEDTGACAVVGSRPVWLWGFEHGVNEHRVAIGNEAVSTVDHAGEEPAALIGMDLVRLGLERGRTAADAVEHMTALLERHGQGGRCHERGGAYDSSFLVADPTEAWVVETAGHAWAARRVRGDAAISNRITLTDDWDRGSGVVGSFDAKRDASPTGFADVRLSASRAFLGRGAAAPEDMMVHLRDHGGAVDALPPEGFDDPAFTICMHVRGISNTTASMVCDLPAEPDTPAHVWAALGNPCCSVFIGFDPRTGVPPALSDPAMWGRWAAVRDAVEAGHVPLRRVREELDVAERTIAAGAGDVSGVIDAALTGLGVA